MIARRILTAVAVAAVVYRTAGGRPAAAGLDDETQEHVLVDPRAARVIHGLTASELASRTDPVDRHFDEAERILRGEPDDDFAATAYGLSLEDLQFLRRLGDQI
jgi:hypothetical protein